MPTPDPPSTERLTALSTDIEAAVRRHAPGWTGPSTGDPGVTLLELLAWIADSLSGYQDRGITPSRSDPYKNFKFRVKWDGAWVAGIGRISGLGRVVQATDYRDGGEPGVVRHVPGAVGYEPITLERAITHDTAFEDWAEQVRQHAAGGAAGVAAGYLKNVRIEVLGPAGEPVIAYDVYRCWPSVYRPLPAMAADEPLRLVEALTLVHDGWERDPTVVYPA